MNFSDVDDSHFEYECSVPIVFATVDGYGTGMVGSAANIFCFLGDFLFDTFFG